ncbi:MAG: hypothetical protein JO296_06800 [Pseudonocardiales bacterium]|nr:hypothetical protein [Pseudonocardiales bacterium]MBV9649832.1 hypothetical protein [Pseudonocardiales bacterium]
MRIASRGHPVSREFTGNHDLGRIGGIVGVITAAVAWYTSAAGVINGMKDRPVLPAAGLWAGALAARCPASTQAQLSRRGDAGATAAPASLAWSLCQPR